MGDLNFRIGTLNDIFQDIDHIPNRGALDNSVNQHGHELINFLNEANFCVLNGRFPEDNYTCISRKGKSVVDYICVPVDTFKNVKNFNVHVSISQALIYPPTQIQLNIVKNVSNSIGFHK